MTCTQSAAAFTSEAAFSGLTGWECVIVVYARFNVSKYFLFEATQKLSSVEGFIFALKV